jgi:hypothetical protein
LSHISSPPLTIFHTERSREELTKLTLGNNIVTIGSRVKDKKNYIQILYSWKFAFPLKSELIQNDQHSKIKLNMLWIIRARFFIDGEKMMMKDNAGMN